MYHKGFIDDQPNKNHAPIRTHKIGQTEGIPQGNNALNKKKPKWILLSTSILIAFE